MALLLNFPLWTAISAIFLAQLVKVPIHFIVTKKTDWSLLTSTGGMPSSHSAAVTALATAVALETGLDSTLFAITTVFALIVMYDAKGVRRQAGEQAAVLTGLQPISNALWRRTYGATNPILPNKKRSSS